MNLLTFHTMLLWVLAGFELLLMLYVLFRYHRSASILALAGLLFGFVVMSVGVALQLGAYDDEARLGMAQLAFYGGSIAFTFLFALAAYFPIPSVRLHRFMPWLVGIPLAFFLPYMFLYQEFLYGVLLNGTRLTILPGPGFWVFAVFVSTYFIGAIAMLFSKFSKVVQEQKKQLVQFAILTLVTGTGGVMFSILLPLIGVEANAVISGEVHGVLTLLIASVVLRK